MTEQDLGEWVPRDALYDENTRLRESLQQAETEVAALRQQREALLELLHLGSEVAADAASVIDRLKAALEGKE